MHPPGQPTQIVLGDKCVHLQHEFTPNNQIRSTRKKNKCNKTIKCDYYISSSAILLLGGSTLMTFSAPFLLLLLYG